MKSITKTLTTLPAGWDSDSSRYGYGEGYSATVRRNFDLLTSNLPIVRNGSEISVYVADADAVTIDEILEFVAAAHDVTIEEIEAKA